MYRFFDCLALPSYCALIYFLSAQPTLPVPPVFEFQDKLLHSGAYFVMGGFAWRAFRHLPLNLWNLALISGLFCSFYGLSDEWHQSFIPNRNASVWDWVADSIGAFLAVSVLYRLSKVGYLRTI